MYLYILKQISALLRDDSEIMIINIFKRGIGQNKITIIYFKEDQTWCKKENFSWYTVWW